MYIYTYTYGFCCWCHCCACFLLPLLLLLLLITTITGRQPYWKPINIHSIGLVLSKCSALPDHFKPATDILNHQQPVVQQTISVSVLCLTYIYVSC